MKGPRRSVLDLQLKPQRRRLPLAPTYMVAVKHEDQARRLDCGNTGCQDTFARTAKGYGACPADCAHREPSRALRASDYARSGDGGVTP